MKIGWTLTALLAIVIVAGHALATPPQAEAEGLNPHFQDDLLDHLVGKWDLAGIVHGNPSTQKIEAEWVLNHQFLRVHETSVQNVPGTKVPYEGLYFIGYDEQKAHYVAHLIDVFGGTESETLGYGQRNGNEITFIFEYADARIVSQFTWHPKPNTWEIVNRPVVASGEAKPFLDLKATPAK